MILQNNELDLNYLYKNGYYRSKISSSTSLDMLSHLKDNEKWTYEEKGHFPVYTANWDIKKSVEKNIAPQIYNSFLQQFIKTKFLKPYTDLFGDFTDINTALHLTPKGYINTWHSHFIDGYHLHLLFHFSDTVREKNDGGLIEFGTSLNPDEYNIHPIDFAQKSVKNVFQNSSYLCQNGDFEVLINSHPMYRHQVTEVLNDKKRYTLMYFLGYKDNILKSKNAYTNL